MKAKSRFLVIVVFVGTVLTLALSPTGAASYQEGYARVLLLPEYRWQWENVDVPVEIFEVEPNQVLEMISKYDVAEIPTRTALAVAQELPGDIFDLNEVPEAWQESGFQPLEFEGRVIGIQSGNYRTLVLMNTPLWQENRELIDEILKHLWELRCPCVERVVQTSLPQPGQQQQQIEPQEHWMLLNQPVFQELFPEVNFDPDDALLREFYIQRAEYSLEGDVYRFTIELSGDGAGSILRDNPQAAQVGVYLDIDWDGISDYVVTSSSEGTWLLTSNLEPVAPPLTSDTFEATGTQLILTVPAGRLGESFDWAVFTAYSSDPNAFTVSPVTNLPFAPIVDIIYPWPDQRTFQVQQTQQQNQTTGNTLFYCGAGTPTGVIWEKTCPDRKIQLECDGGSFGRKVWSDTWGEGYIAKCPYSAGRNVSWDIPDETCRPQIVWHQVTNSSGTEMMQYRYDFSTNEDYITNFHDITKCQPYPTSPLPDISSVPGNCP